MFARVAARQSAQTLLRRPQQANLSVMSSLRSFARSFEPHPFQRVPVTVKPAPADFSRLLKRSAGNAVVFFPVAGGLLGWPYIAKTFVDGSV
ncbi:hypothetical protein VTJ49DRAFT_2922 [Mycothermus thermophilus]|uniref:Uncharacterized protein n=1 Tax=Humicola insolens TaxID=85995 RepID=A0ABR3V8S4_HUMIN